MHRHVGAKLPLYTFGIKAQTTLGSNKTVHTGNDNHFVLDDVGGSDDYGKDDSQQENYFLDELLLAQVWPFLLVFIANVAGLLVS